MARAEISGPPEWLRRPGWVVVPVTVHPTYPGEMVTYRIDLHAVIDSVPVVTGVASLFLRPGRSGEFWWDYASSGVTHGSQCALFVSCTTSTQWHKCRGGIGFSPYPDGGLRTVFRLSDWR